MKYFFYYLCLSMCLSLSISAPIKPPHLKVGDKVALVQVGYAVSADKVHQAMLRVKAFGLEPVISDDVYQQYLWFAGSDESRAKEVNDAFLNPEIKAVFEIAGGYGAMRVLPLIDYAAIQAHPKVVMGYSDDTALLNAIFTKTNLITFYGPMFGLTVPKSSANMMKSILFEGEVANYENIQIIDDSDLIPLKKEITTIHGGHAEGVLVGGNLSIIQSLLATPYMISDWHGKILFVEDVGEDLYRIDRMLTQLELAGVLDQISGFIFGTCEQCLSNRASDLALDDILADHFKNRKIPVISGLLFGHQPKTYTIPIGVRAKLDADKKVLSLMESAVSK